MQRGDIYNVDLDPVEGSEQRGRRFVMIVSPAAFNAKGLAWVVPITQGGYARAEGFTVSLATSGMRTGGVVLCHQIRTLDLKARKARRIEAAPKAIVEEVMAAIADIIAG